MEEKNNIIRKGNQDSDDVRESVLENVKEETLEDKTEVVDSAKENKEESKKEKKPKKKVNKQVIALVCIVLSCVVITVGLIILKIRDISKKYPPIKNEEVFETENKIDDPDAIYATDENTTYFFNELNEETIYEKDGSIVPDGRPYQEGCYSYSKISGLKNKEIENKINEDIRNSLISVMNSEDDLANTYINASFSNILSVRIQTLHGVCTGLNYDLNTGDKIQFEDLFTKSTPMKSILANSLGRTNAWRNLINELTSWSEARENGEVSDDEYMKKIGELFNMDNTDFSQDDDFLLKVSKAYDNLKGNINFCVSPFTIDIYNEFPNVLESGYEGIAINTYEYSQYFTAFKKYSGSGKSIYETTNTMQENIRATYMPMNYFYRKNDRNIICEDLADNLFCDIAVDLYNGNIENVQKAVDINRTNIDNIINEVKLMAQQDKSHGYVLQGQIFGAYDYASYVDYELQKYLKPHIQVLLRYSVTKFDSDKYKNLNYYLGKVSSIPISSTTPQMFSERNLQNVSGISVTENSIAWYFDKDGNYVGTDKNMLIDYEREERYNPS